MNAELKGKCRSSGTYIMDIGHRGRYFRSEPVLQPAAAEPYAGRFGRLGLSGQSDSHDYAK